MCFVFINLSRVVSPAWSFSQVLSDSVIFFVLIELINTKNTTLSESTCEHDQAGETTLERLINTKHIKFNKIFYSLHSHRRENSSNILYNEDFRIFASNVSYIYIVNSKWVNGIYFKYITHIYFLNILGGRRGRDCMVVGFTTTCAISVYHRLLHIYGV
jgi:hypothetical protein